MTAFLRIVCFALFLLCISADEVPQTKKSIEELKKMKIKDLKKFLSERGLSCVGCAEKDDFIHMAFDNQDKPVISEPEKPAAKEESGGFDDADKDSNIDDIMEKLKSSGINAQMFTKKDMENMNTEDMAKKFGGRGKSSSGRKAKDSSSSSSTKKAKATKTDDEKIEL